MSYIFCENCGSSIPYSASNCKCGHTMNDSEKSEIQNRIQKIQNVEFIDDSLENKASIAFIKISKNKLDWIYFSPGSVKRAFIEKYNFFKDEAIPPVNNWQGVINKAKKDLANDKIRVSYKIIEITEFILKEFFGPFKIKENGVQNFEAYQDFGKNFFIEALPESKFDFSNIQTENFGSIGLNILSSVGDTLKYGTLSKLPANQKISDADLKTIKNEVGIVIANELIEGIGRMIRQNIEAIKQIREYDNELNKSISNLSNKISSLHIDHHELKKKKKSVDNGELILVTCYEKIIKPIINELNNDPVYIEYKRKRKPFDLQQNKIKIDERLLNENVEVSFWGCLLSSSSTNFKVYWKKRLGKVNETNKYSELNTALNEKNHNTLNEMFTYHALKHDDFKEFEKINRDVIKYLPVFNNNKKNVAEFARVLAEVKSNLNK